MRNTKWSEDSNDTLACFCDFILFQFQSADRFLLGFHQRKEMRFIFLHPLDSYRAPLANLGLSDYRGKIWDYGITHCLKLRLQKSAFKLGL